jgi:hypothetical protein
VKNLVKVISVSAIAGVMLVACGNTHTAKTSPIATGIAVTANPLSWAPVSAFAAETDTHPHFILSYAGLDPFTASFARTISAHGDLPVIQIDPGSVQMSAVAAGAIDKWANTYAAAVRVYHKPIVLGFAAEANGTWDQWGRGHTSPAQWVAAWRHLVQLFRHDGANNVIWLWTVSAVNIASASMGPWWPGSSFVTWIGIDGYYTDDSSTWSSVFGVTIARIRALTNQPILISETSVAPSPAAATQVTGLFANARMAGVIGVIWFNQRQDSPPYHDDWDLSDDPGALAAYKSAA